MAHFLWSDSENNKKYHLANWELVSLRQESGGLGAQSLRDFNLCLLASWIKRYHFDENKIWRKIVDYKYDLDPNIFYSNPTNCSPFWKGVIWAARAAKMGFRWVVGNGQRVKFWSDVWIGTCSLAIVFWDLFVISNEQEITVAQALQEGEVRLTFRRNVSPALYQRWLELTQLVNSVTLTQEVDNPVWMFHSSGTYSIRSFYAIVNDRGVVPIHTPAVWSLCVPPRLHVFL